MWGPHVSDTIFFKLDLIFTSCFSYKNRWPWFTLLPFLCSPLIFSQFSIDDQCFKSIGKELVLKHSYKYQSLSHYSHLFLPEYNWLSPRSYSSEIYSQPSETPSSYSPLGYSPPFAKTDKKFNPVLLHHQVLLYYLKKLRKMHTELLSEVHKCSSERWGVIAILCCQLAFIL